MADRNTLKERIKMVKAMEYIARQVNDEDVFEGWLMAGVADGDIKYGDLEVPENIEDDEAFWYAGDPDTFAELMGCFLRIMARAKKSGGLYCGNVVSVGEER